MQDLLTISEAAQRLGASPSSVKRWCNEGKLRVEYTVGGQRRIPASEIEELLRRTSATRVEHTERQTRAAREALAAKRGTPPTMALFGKEDTQDVAEDEALIDEEQAEFGKLVRAMLEQNSAQNSIEGDGFENEEGD